MKKFIAATTMFIAFSSPVMADGYNYCSTVKKLMEITMQIRQDFPEAFEDMLDRGSDSSHPNLARLLVKKAWSTPHFTNRHDRATAIIVQSNTAFDICMLNPKNFMDLDRE